MIEQQDREQRIAWTTRINLRPQAAKDIKTMAANERISVATMIGVAIETYVISITRRSSS